MHYFSGKGCFEFLESMHYCIGILILVFFSEKVVGVFAFEAIRSIVKFAPDGIGYRTKIIFAKEKLLIDRMSDILLRFFNID